MKEQSVTISKRTLIFAAIAAVVVLAGAVTAVVLIEKGRAPAAAVSGQTTNPDVDPDAAVWTGQQPVNRDEGEKEGIKIPGYPSITIPKKQTDVSVALLNPEGNPCYFTFELILKETGETLYRSKMVPPGQAITKIQLAQGLPEGEHPATILIRTTSLADGTAMNGANVETVLIAK